MSTKRLITRRMLREREQIAKAAEILAVPWPKQAVTEEERREAARALGITRYLSPPQQALSLKRAA